MILTVGIKQKIFLDRSPPIFFTVVCLCACARHGKKLCATKNRHNYLKFCAFAKKNAVSLTNQGCKGCQNEALCHKLKLCATTQSKLSKNSAQAEFLCFCTRLLVKHEFPDAKAKLCATKPKQTIPRIRHKPNS